jgi:2-dehydro-3-deoxyphosphogluconate aldolase/(4S)-4-hydroxy-2-oxoglutarate aldolase
MSTQTGSPITSINQIAPLRIIPVLTITDIKHVDAIANAVVECGIQNVEVTLRTDVSLAAIEAFAKHPNLVVGVGSVKNSGDLSRAVDAGATFAVSPGYLKEIGETAKKLNVFYLPGVATSTEIMSALSDGFNLLKFFPAEQLGGVQMLKAIAPVFPSVQFIPTGGINGENIDTNLAHPSVVAVGGSWMLGKTLDLNDRAAVNLAVSTALKKISSPK